MSRGNLSYSEMKKIFGWEFPKRSFLDAEAAGNIPAAKRVPFRKDKVMKRVWNYSQIGVIGKKYGYLKAPETPSCLTMFSSKGGVLKSTLVLNMARLYGIHGVKTCVLDLDPQCDTTRNLGIDIDDQSSDLDEIDNFFNGIPSLVEFFEKKMPLKEVIRKTEITDLDIIPASPALIPLSEVLSTKKRREYWLKEKVVEPLFKMGYKLVIIDLPPSWTILTSQAITAANLVISPIECKIAHYRNVYEFINQMDDFLEEMKILNQKRIFVPTKVSASKKISLQILNAYKKTIEECSFSTIRDTVVGEEATAIKKSVPEYLITSPLAEDVKSLAIEISGLLK